VCDVICSEAVPFRPYCAGVATRTRNVSEYMLVLALCLVLFVVGPSKRVLFDKRSVLFSCYNMTVGSLTAAV